jgi:hypothetical protein
VVLHPFLLFFFSSFFARVWGDQPPEGVRAPARQIFYLFRLRSRVLSEASPIAAGRTSLPTCRLDTLVLGDRTRVFSTTVPQG